MPLLDFGKRVLYRCSAPHFKAHLFLVTFLVVLAGIFICQGGISRSVIAIRRWRTRDKVNTGVL